MIPYYPAHGKDEMRARYAPDPSVEKEGFPMAEPKKQCIHCSVESCRHLQQEKGLCSLESIQVSPTPMAYSGDPADESMCSGYECR